MAEMVWFTTWRCNCTQLVADDSSLLERCPVHDEERLCKPQLVENTNSVPLGFVEAA